MPDPFRLDASRVLDAGAAEGYEAAVRALSRALIYLHVDLRLLEQLRNFRWDLHGGSRALFGFLFHNLLERSVDIARRMWGEPGAGGRRADPGEAGPGARSEGPEGGGRPGPVTLRRLRRLVLDGVKPEHEAAVRARLDSIDADAALRDAFRRIDALRDTRDPHDTVGYAFDPEAVQKLGAVLRELRTAAELLGALYNALTFGPARLFDPAGLEPNWLSQRTGDLGHLLDLLVLHGRWSEAYDHEPELWEENYRELLDVEDLKAINRIRLRFGRAGIPLDRPTD